MATQRSTEIDTRLHASLLNTGEWGDITVKYGDITRTLHSAIVCSQSPFFADAVTKAVTVIPTSLDFRDR